MEKIILYEFGKAQKLPETERHQFESFLEEIWQNRLWEEILEENSPASNSQKIFDLRNDTIRARNYSGYLRWNDLEIQIFPKIFATHKHPDTDLVFRHLNYYLSYCFSLNLPFYPDEQDFLPGGNLMDFWAQLFVQITWNYLSQKPHFAYENQQETNTYFKGRLAVSEYIRTGLSRANWHQTTTDFSKLTYNNRFNRLVRYVFLQLLQDSRFQIPSEKIEGVLWLLQDCQAQPASFRDCQKLRAQCTHPLQKIIITFCEIFLLNENINDQFGAKHHFSFLLPMETVFEQFIYGFLNEHFPEQQAVHQSRSYLALNKGEGKQAFLLKQDIYLPHQHKIIDTKYKVRKTPFRDSTTGVDNRDMYQMLSYGIARDCSDIVLLYPAGFQETATEQKNHEFIVQGKLLGDKQIRISACDLDITEANAENFKANLDQKIKVQLEKLLFGKF